MGGKEKPTMNEVIAANIRNRRENRAWTQEHLAEAAKISVCREPKRVEG